MRKLIGLALVVFAVASSACIVRIGNQDYDCTQHDNATYCTAVPSAPSTLPGA